MPKAKKSEVVDPIALAQATRHGEVPMFEKEPLRTWVLGLLDVKIARGRGYSWTDMLAVLTLAAKAALEPRAKIRLGTVDRMLTESERAVLAGFVKRKYSDHSISFLVRRSFPQLWAQAVGKTEA